jgi:hypothetical protein
LAFALNALRPNAAFFRFPYPRPPFPISVISVNQRSDFLAGFSPYLRASVADFGFS